MVEKMTLVTVIGDLNYSEKVLKTLIKMGEVTMADASVGVAVMRENYDESWQIPTDILAKDLKKIEVKRSLAETEDKLMHLFERTDLEKVVDSTCIDINYSREQLASDVDHMYEDFSALGKKIEDLNKRREQLVQFSHVDKLAKVDFDLSKLKALNHFDIRLGYMLYEYERRLDLNYDNINALVLRAGNIDKSQLYFIITPRIMRQQTENLLRSMHFSEVDILWEYMDFPNQMAEHLKRDLDEIEQQIEALKGDVAEYLDKHRALLVKAYTHLNLEASCDDVATKFMHDDAHFLCAFWLAAEVAADFELRLKDEVPQITCISHGDDALQDVVVPTKLKNKRLFQPFEMLVSLYGTPNYREVDPTGFLALAYMFLFGAMFGDLGQGFVFWLGGFFLKKREKMASIGGVLQRIGVSSMIFGVIYDSIFGVEHAISHFLTERLGLAGLSAIFLRPIENTNIMLMASIVIGFFFLLISYGFSIYNKLKHRDIKEGVFGRNGINGLVLFLALIAVAGMVYFSWPSWAVRIGMVVVGICAMLLVVREPLSNLLAKQLPLYHEGASAYYVESGFELLETFLGMLSNGISFIRVGAFALNHVGLFIAFQTIANMIGTGAGNVLMFILGNLLVIGLEGLIVFIQGLRLVYYEMFSKFYQGDGQPFVGMDVSMHYDKLSEEQRI